MKVGLICSDNVRFILYELLASRNISIDESSDVYIVESGYTAPPLKLSILFELSCLNLLIGLLERINKTHEDTADNIIGRSDNGNFEILQYKYICFFEGRGNSTFCITKDGEYKVKDKLYELDTKLPKNSFVRVGKSFIVNIENVKQIVPWFGRRLVLKFTDCKREVEVSKNYTKSFKDFLDM